MIFPWLEPVWQTLVDNWDRIPNAWLFEAEPGIGRNLFVKELVKALLCESPLDNHHPCENCPSCHFLDEFSHPDFYDVLYLQMSELFPQQEQKAVRVAAKTRTSFKEKKEDTVIDDGVALVTMKDVTGKEHSNALSMGELPQIKIGGVREVQEKLYTSSSRQGRKVVLINPAHLLTIEASNALLKNLEEPPQNVVFILVTDNKDKLLPTIRSRCRLIRLPKPSIEEAFRCVQEMHPQWSQEECAQFLAFNSGRPLIEENQIEASMRDLFVRTVAQPTLKGALDFVQEYAKQKLPLVLFLDWFHKWLTDLAALNQGLKVSYFPRFNRELTIISQRFGSVHVYGLIDKINHLSRYSSISFNLKIQVECLLLEYLKLCRS